jgi:polysaccharide pyruvyl transferase WcaK-like protein
VNSKTGIHALIHILNESMSNHGDIAQHQVTFSRLGRLFPEAQLQVVTGSPDRVRLFYPGVDSIPEQGHKLYFRPGSLLGRFSRLAPRLDEKLLRDYPTWTMPLIMAKCRLRHTSAQEAHSYYEALHLADLVVVPGGNWILGEWSETGRLVLETLAVAQRLGKATALVGHCFEPARNRALRTKVKNVLRRVDLITIRESRVSLPFLLSLGIPPGKVVVTGDDAIEVAYAARPCQLGAGIGVNLRWASYTELTADHLEATRIALNQAARTCKAALIPIPIEFANDNLVQSDAETIKRLLAGREDHANGGEELHNSPRGALRQVSACRIVVTGSYHAAVFALSQGIPAIGLAKSAHYVDRFLGLAQQFGHGCTLVRLDDEDLTHKLFCTIEDMWRSADDLRPHLLAAAERQIKLGREAYRRLLEIVSARRDGSKRPRKSRLQPVA